MPPSWAFHRLAFDRLRKRFGLKAAMAELWTGILPVVEVARSFEAGETLSVISTPVDVGVLSGAPGALAHHALVLQSVRPLLVWGWVTRLTVGGVAIGNVFHGIAQEGYLPVFNGTTVGAFGLGPEGVDADVQALVGHNPALEGLLVDGFGFAAPSWWANTPVPAGAFVQAPVFARPWHLPAGRACYWQSPVVSGAGVGGLWTFTVLYSGDPRDS